MRCRWAAWCASALSSGVWTEHLFLLECARRPLFLLGYKRGWILGRSDMLWGEDRGGHAVRVYVNLVSVALRHADERCTRWQLALVCRPTYIGDGDCPLLSPPLLSVIVWSTRTLRPLDKQNAE